MEQSPGRGPPLYAQIAAMIRGRIAAGELQPGDMAPGELAIRDEYQVSRYTAARALDLLAAEGLIRRKAGIGSVVTSAPAIRVVEAGPGARVAVRMPGPGEGWAPMITVTAPGGKDEVYPAIGTIVLAVGEIVTDD